MWNNWKCQIYKWATQRRCKTFEDVYLRCHDCTRHWRTPFCTCQVCEQTYTVTEEVVNDWIGHTLGCVNLLCVFRVVFLVFLWRWDDVVWGTNILCRLVHYNYDYTFLMGYSFCMRCFDRLAKNKLFFFQFFMFLCIYFYFIFFLFLVSSNIFEKYDY